MYDADLKGYFNSIPHTELLARGRLRVVDRWVLQLIRMWLEAPRQYLEPGGEGNYSTNSSYALCERAAIFTQTFINVPFSWPWLASRHRENVRVGAGVRPAGGHAEPRQPACERH